MVSLFSEVAMETGPAFLSCPMMGARFGLLDVVCITDIIFDDNCGIYWVRLGAGIERSTRTGFRASGKRKMAGCFEHTSLAVCRFLS